MRLLRPNCIIHADAVLHVWMLHGLTELQQEVIVFGATVAAGIVSGLLEFTTRCGADGSKLIAAAHIDPVRLGDPDARVPLDRYIALMRAAKSATNDTALALKFSENVSVSDMSILGLIMEASATMGEAFIQLQRYSQVAAETSGASEGPQFEVVSRGGRLFMVDHRQHPNLFPELTEFTFGSLTCGPRRFLPRPHVLAVYVTHRAPPHAAEYERVFQCPVHFGCHWNAMQLHPDVAEWKVAQAPRYVFGVLAQHADGLLTNLEAGETLCSRIEKLVLPTLHHSPLTAEAVAARLGFSRQTLFRKLREEGQSFSNVIQDLRRRLAIAYIEGRIATVTETAYLLGFSDFSSFSRAFKRWTGVAPSEYRHLDS
ncbi:AraC family transcriptional regulator [Chelativorans salis]|uniref:AraC family transcriptional regulator n=1 Tax=Chelativorans salis TaxID=2978478 RepID=A0ABT2LP53_9HYPH|nr:AraC family transcriptional regulator [Chelativorans sp. EGI FJ00035]MCT7376341.1 AraC family transcriptional regulator [Chelativorans sp. EGI FJ00035]